MKPSSESQIFDGLQNGEIWAFELLFDKYYRMMCFYTAKLVKDKTIVENIVADVFFELWKKRSSVTSMENALHILFQDCTDYSVKYLQSNELIDPDRVERLKIYTEVVNSRFKQGDS